MMLLNYGFGENSRDARRLLRDARRLLRDARSNQSILKEISPEYSSEGLMLKLKLHLMQRTDSFEKTLMLGD